MTDGLTTHNPAALVEPPVAHPKEIDPLTIEEARALIEKAATQRLRVLWLVLLALGLRLGEALALCWEDLDLDRGTVSIRRSVQRVRSDPDPITGRCTTRLVESLPKTAASRATIAVPDMLIAVLREHKALQNEEHMKARKWIDPGLVFASTVGTYLEQRNVNRDWTELCKAAGVRRVRVHDLRHAAASFMFTEGVEMKLIQATLRHSRLSTTADIYTRVVLKVQRQAADRMDDVLRRISEQGESILPLRMTFDQALSQTVTLAVGKIRRGNYVFVTWVGITIITCTFIATRNSS
ncbi:MAG: tyrosine-type recombinase/integrase [Actinomycetota bacterium]